nr:PAS domain-containing protein [Candidatus Saccharibacteria bacterium]
AELLLTLLSISFGWLIARSIDHYVQTAHMASAITNQLDSTQLSEKLMLSAIADPVVGINKKMEIILFNSAAEELSSWDSTAASGVELQTVFQLKDNNENAMNKANNPFLKVFSQKDQITTDEFHLQSKDNTKRAFSISVAPTFDMDNNINGAIAVFHDISDQKGLQRERNEFVSTASHEMRTPVAAIEGYLSMAINPNLATVDDRAKNFLEKAHQSAIHLGKLFQDLLSVTKIEDQRLKDQRQVFNMTDLVTQVATEMDVVAKKKGLTFFSHIGSEKSGAELVVAPLYQVNADPERVREVVTNLIDNAIKYTPKGNIDLTLTGDRNNVKVSVRDTGMGIPLEEQKHMFEKFYRVNNSMTREIGGTGLGLYIARSLIELYGGRIWVESVSGEGSTFNFSLPLVKS